MCTVGIHALCVEQSRNQLRTLLQLEKLELLMLDIFNYNLGNSEIWWNVEVKCWKYLSTFRVLQSNLNSWSF